MLKKVQNTNLAHIFNQKTHTKEAVSLIFPRKIKIYTKKDKSNL